MDLPSQVAAEVSGSWIVPTCYPLHLRLPKCSLSIITQVGKSVTRGLGRARSWSGGHTISLIQIWYGTSNNEQLELFWNLFETWEDSDASHFTHFSIRAELLAVWPSFHLPCMSTGYLFTHPVNFTFTSKRSWIYHIRLKQSPIQRSRPLETTEFNTRCQSKIRFGSRLQLSFCSIMNQD